MIRVLVEAAFGFEADRTRQRPFRDGCVVTRTSSGRAVPAGAISMPVRTTRAAAMVQALPGAGCAMEAGPGGEPGVHSPRGCLTACAASRRSPPAPVQA